MDWNIGGLMLVMIISIMVVVATFQIKTSAIRDTANFGKETIASEYRAAGSAFHIMSAGSEFGKISESRYQQIVQNCGDGSGLPGFREDISVIAESSLESRSPGGCSFVEASAFIHRSIFFRLSVETGSGTDSRGIGVAYN